MNPFALPIPGLSPRRPPGPLGGGLLLIPEPGPRCVTPGPLGWNDAADPTLGPVVAPEGAAWLPNPPGRRAVVRHAPEVAAVDLRSERVIATLLPEVRPYARKLVHAAAEQDITIKVISGLRTYAEQDALYAQGRAAQGSIVTKAQGGYSCHNFGIAFDIGVFEDGKYLGYSKKYDLVGPLGVAIGLEWGGNWKSFRDRPHYQLRPQWADKLSESQMLAELRSKVAKGQPIYTPS